MPDITTNDLRGIIKTLGDVVAPAIPADDPLAIQELKMVVRYLVFCRERVDHLHARARFELDFYAKLAAECGELIAPKDATAARELASLSQGAQALLEQAGATVTAMRERTQEIMTRLTRLLGEIDDADALSKVERAILRGSAQITAFDRSWYLPLKLERFPQDVRPLGSFIPL